MQAQHKEANVRMLVAMRHVRETAPDEFFVWDLSVEGLGFVSETCHSNMDCLGPCVKSLVDAGQSGVFAAGVVDCRGIWPVFPAVRLCGRMMWMCVRSCMTSVCGKGSVVWRSDAHNLTRHASWLCVCVNILTYPSADFVGSESLDGWLPLLRR
jgi:hypothetical protein